MLPLWIRMNLGAMGMKEYSIFSKIWYTKWRLNSLLRINRSLINVINVKKRVLSPYLEPHRCVQFSFIWFYVISILVGYFMSKTVYTSMVCYHILLITSLNESKLIFCTDLSGFKYSFLIVIILFTINYLFADRWFQVLLCSSNNLTPVKCLPTFK